MGSSDYEKHEPENYRKLFIGGLDYRTSDESLKEFFGKWGEIVDVVVMKDPVTKRSRGFGFITYSKSSMVDDAMANRPHRIDNRQVETKRAVPRDEIGKPESGVTVTKMFVGGIKENVAEDDLKEYFGTFGTVTSVTIPTSKETGAKRGFAFVEFDDYDPVDKIVLQKKHTINGKVVDVKKALARDAVAKVGTGGRKGGRGGNDGGWGNRAPSQDNWGNGYGGSPWNSQADQGWGNQQGGQGWGAQGNDSYGNSQPWGNQQNQGYTSGGPMRNSYSSGNRSAPYGHGASNGGYGGGYGNGGGGGRRY